MNNLEIIEKATTEAESRGAATISTLDGRIFLLSRDTVEALHVKLQEDPQSRVIVMFVCTDPAKAHLYKLASIDQN